MKRWMWISMILLLGVAVLALWGVNRVSVDQRAHHKMTIGLSFDSLVVERWKRDMETIVAVANENGYDVDVQIANDDLSEQKRQIQYLIDKGVDALIILPKEKTAYTELIRQARSKGIHVVAYDRLIMDADVEAYMAFENVGIGRKMAQHMVTALQKKGGASHTLMIINGDPEDNNSGMFNKGFFDVLNRPENKGRIQVISEVWSPGWRESYATESVEKLLAQGVVPDGILTGNDVLATAAIQALSERQLAGKVEVVSEDAELSACQRIVEGTQLATVYKPYTSMARSAVQTCIELINGSFHPKETLWNGLKTIPVVKLDGTLVDRSNIDKVIIESGFHSKEDVYRNVKP